MFKWLLKPDDQAIKGKTNSKERIKVIATCALVAGICTGLEAVQGDLEKPLPVIVKTVGVSTAVGTLDFLRRRQQGLMETMITPEQTEQIQEEPSVPLPVNPERKESDEGKKL